MNGTEIDDDTGVALMTRNDSEGITLDPEIALKPGKNGGAPAVEIRREHGGERVKAESAQKHQSSHAEPEPPAKAGRRPWAWALFAVAAVAAVAAGVPYYFYSLSYESTDDAFVDGHIVAVSPRVAGHVAKVYVTDNQWVNQGELVAELDPRDFQARLAAAEAALTAARAGEKSRSIGTDVTEITSTAGVDEASAAVEGARAAVTTALAAVATARSQQAQAQAQLAAVEAGLKQAQADLSAADARQQRAGAFLKRIEALVPEHAASQDSLDEAVAAQRVASADVSAVRQRIVAQEAAVRQAEAAVAAAQSGVRQAESGVVGQEAALQRAEAQRAGTRSAPKQVAQSRSQTNVAEAEVARAEAEAEQARLNLTYTKIYAPISGQVTRKSVEQGAYVQTGQPVLALVDPDVWVIANFKETQLAKMRAGQPVTVSVDTRPGVNLAAHVDSLQLGSGARFSLLPPENATGNYVKVVQRVPVKIVFDDPKQVAQYGLGPGMSVLPSVKVSEPGRTSIAGSGVLQSR
jgi:membrane fusion protein (multidrug efflux system)